MFDLLFEVYLFYANCKTYNIECVCMLVHFHIYIDPKKHTHVCTTISTWSFNETEVVCMPFLGNNNHLADTSQRRFFFLEAHIHNSCDYYDLLWADHVLRTVLSDLHVILFHFTLTVTLGVVLSFFYICGSWGAEMPVRKYQNQDPHMGKSVSHDMLLPAAHSPPVHLYICEPNESRQKPLLKRHPKKIKNTK